MRHFSISKRSFAAIRPLLLATSTALSISLCACSTVPVAGPISAPEQPPTHPKLPRPAPLSLKKFHVNVLPGHGNVPPLVTLTPQDYTALQTDLSSIMVELCEDNWLLDYYEGKNDGQRIHDYCKDLPAPTK